MAAAFRRTYLPVESSLRLLQLRPQAAVLVVVVVVVAVVVFDVVVVFIAHRRRKCWHSGSVSTAVHGVRQKGAWTKHVPLAICGWKRLCSTGPC